ncbi:MAG: hypothetical protein U5M53_03870 [Rhodoferax sp.]|nr:hypothetical protein [Rhodoferax sp.]
MKDPIRAGVVTLVIALLAGAWLQPLDAPAKRQVDDGLQRALVTYGSARLLHALVAWSVAYLRQATIPAWLQKLALVLLLVRFAVPLSLMGSALLFEQILHAPYLESQAALGALTTNATNQSAAVTKPVPPEPAGMVDSVKKWFGDKAAVATEKLDGLRQVVADAAEHLIRLMAVFLSQTIVLPLLLVVGLWAALLAVFRP